MLTVDVISVLWGALGAVLLFLIGWAAKHALDRLILPKLLDWWATRTRVRAAKRAEIIVSRFIYEINLYQDVRMLLYRTDSEMRRAVFHLVIVFVFVSATLTTIIIEPDFIFRKIAKSGNKIDYNIYNSSIIMIIAFSLLIICFIIFWLSFGKATLDPDMIRRPREVAERTLARIDKLLRRAGFSDLERTQWRREHAESIIRIAHPQTNECGTYLR